MPRYDRYTADAIALLQAAQAKAAGAPGNEMTPSIVLEAFLSGESDLKRRFLEEQRLEMNPPVAPCASPAAADDVKQVVLSADLRRDLDEAEASTPDAVTPWHLLSAIWPDVQGRLVELVRREGLPVAPPVPLPSLSALPPAPATRPRQSRPALSGPLKEFGRDLSTAPPSHPLVGRDRELNELIAILLKYHKPNAVLLGDAGVGKTAIVEGLAARINAGDVPPGLRDKRIVELPMGSLVAGTVYHGSYEQRLKDLVEQVEADQSIILFIDELHMIAGGRGRRGTHGEASDMLKPALARGRMRVIGATTWGEYYESIESDPALKRRFHEIRVEEPADDAVAGILAGAMPPMLAHHGLEAGPEIVPLVVSLCRTELPSRRFPDKAIDVVDRACSQAALAGASRLSPEHIRGVIASLAGIAFTTDSQEFRNSLASLEDALKRQVLRQDEAVQTVARTVRLCKRRLDLKTHRPDGVFLFVGRSGVGKTALATALAETLLGSEDAVIRLDMTGFSEPHSVSTLLGSPPGYVGSDEEPAWLEQLRKRPSAVLVLDELEKAHPQVLKVFLRAFDEGELVDARGNTYSLANVTVIATSNAHVDTEGGGFGFHASERDEHREWVNGLQDYFPPEFLNRFDEIVPFDPLTAADLGIIVREKILPQAGDKLLAECNTRLTMTDGAIRRVAELADSASFGARELDRVFRNHVLLPAAEAVHALRSAQPSARGTVVVDRSPEGGLSVVLRADAAGP
jgi:ATP-dependent Clp protease ATP-binding subunit ClpC